MTNDDIINVLFDYFQIEELSDVYSFIYQSIGLQWSD